MSYWWADYIRRSWEERANNNRLPEYLLTCAREARKLGVVVPREYILYDTVTGEHLERLHFTRQEAASKIEELRKVIEKADGEIARLQSIAQLEKQSEETVEATRKALERLRDTNLKTASFDDKAELVAKLSIKSIPQ